MHICPTRIFALAALALLLCARSISAEPGFVATLSAEDKNTIGLATLSGEQQAALDEQVQRDIKLARQGNVVGFAKTFSLRRTPEQARAIGLSQLPQPGIDLLDKRIAYAIAHRPPASFTYDSGASKPVPETSVKVTRPPLEIHGQFSVVYGQSSGDSFYGGDFDVSVYDPVSRITIMVGASSYRGHIPFYQLSDPRFD
jgi:hypothetical protein